MPENCTKHYPPDIVVSKSLCSLCRIDALRDDLDQTQDLLREALSLLSGAIHSLKDEDPELYTAVESFRARANNKLPNLTFYG